MKANEKSLRNAMKVYLLIGKTAHVGTFRQKYPYNCKGYTVEELNKIFIEVQKEVFNK